MTSWNERPNQLEHSLDPIECLFFGSGGATALLVGAPFGWSAGLTNLKKGSERRQTLWMIQTMRLAARAPNMTV
jgi:hypothetical protein